MLMELSNWSDILHFSKNEQWGSWEKMDKRIFYYLEAMRQYCGKSIVIHCGYEEGGHTKTSQHYLGLAVDFHIVGMSLMDQYLLAERFPWNGLGIYPNKKNKLGCWNNEGLHADVRVLEDNEKGSRWAGVNDGNGKMKYVTIDQYLINKIITNI